MRGAASLAAIVLLGACGPQAQTQPKASPSPSKGAQVRTTPLPLDQVPPDVSQLWGDLGATIVPPTGYLQKIDFSAEVVNHSGGKVDDATARKWAEGLEREYLWDKWVGENLQLDLLTKLGRKDSMTQQAVFSDDYSSIHKAQDVGGRLRIVFGARPRMTLLPVPPDLRDTLTRTYNYTPPIPEWAFAVDVGGAGSNSLIYPDGHTETLSEHPASFRARVFIAGAYQDYPGTLGAIWVLSTFLSCDTNDFLRGPCSS
jgi:hypothetical protein